ncbi:MAG: hypothetical protein LBJ31_08310 [Treponema sp.]|jgi:hypothetical protein|nr:hypothetical protein [Treponema sp.]
MKQFVKILSFSLFLIGGCKAKQDMILNEYKEEFEDRDDITIDDEIIFYVGPFEGLNLREGPYLASEKIRTLSQYL